MKITQKYVRSSTTEDDKVLVETYFLLTKEGHEEFIEKLSKNFTFETTMD